MATSEKDLGNQCFKRTKYVEAIEHYKNYIKDEHQDNKKALFNLSLCYSKLGKVDLSIESAVEALKIDKSYTKCYYRLALEYQQLTGKQYEVFINAIQFLRLAGEKQVAEREDMKKVAAKYKQILSKTGGNNLKIESVEQIITGCMDLVPKRELNVSVDKQLTEWLAEWKVGTQSEQAKWVQIAYIMEEIDYDYGLNLAYFYINQLSDPQLKAKVRKDLKELRQSLKKESEIRVEDLEIEKEGMVQKQEDNGEVEEENLFQEEKLSEDVQKEMSSPTKIMKKNSSSKEIDVKKSENISVKNPLKILEEKKKKMEQSEVGQSKSQILEHKAAVKQQKGNSHIQVPSKKEETTNEKPKSQQKGNNAQLLKKSMKDLSEIDLQDIYSRKCGHLLTMASSLLMKGVIKSVIDVLQSEMDSQVKAWLLGQMRKRMKKFDPIMKTVSEGEQKVIRQLLVKSGLEEQYADHFLPKYHKK